MTAVTIRPARSTKPAVAPGTGWAGRLQSATSAGPVALRSQAAARFESLGFPGTRDEDWRFTPLTPITQRAWSRPAECKLPGIAEVDALAMGNPDWHRLVFVNGRLEAGLSRVGPLPRGVRLGSLRRALAVDAGPLSRFHGQAAGFEQHALTALNTALFEDGACLFVGAGLELTMPVELLFLTHPGAAPASNHPRNLIVLGPNARATVMETYRSLGDGPHFTNPVTEAVVQRGAHLSHLKVGLENQQAVHVGRFVGSHEQASRLTSLAVSLGAALHRNDLDVEMHGTGCEVTLNGLYMGQGEQLLDNHTSIRHSHESCASRELYVGVLDDNSHGVFNGKVYVTPEAQKTDGKQTNRNLLLSDRARIDTKPQLEIFADDVKCTHGATVGRLDEMGIFYLQTRGIAGPLARRLLTFAFAAEVLKDLPFPAVRQRIEALVLARLDGRTGK